MFKVDSPVPECAGAAEKEVLWGGWEIYVNRDDIRCGRCVRPGSWVSGSEAYRDPKLVLDQRRCTNEAGWVKRGTCGCGKGDVTRYACSDCLVMELMRECRSRDGMIEEAINIIRQGDRSYTSRDMVFCKICGVSKHPPDPPDEYWKATHRRLRGKIWSARKSSKR
jgi:hypothetical protein